MKLYGLEFLTEDKGSPKTHPMNWAQTPYYSEVFLNPNAFIQKKPIVINPGSSKSKILILAGDSVSVGYLCNQLKKQKIGFISVNLDEFIFSGQMSYSTKEGVRFKQGKQVIKIDGVTKVVYMPPQFLMGLDAHPEILTNEEKILLSRWRSMLHDLEIFIPLDKWFPTKPRELYESSQQKLSDLVLAQELGIKTPDTIVTMNPVEAKKFVAAHDGQVIFRDYSVRRVHTKKRVETFRIDFVKPKSKTWKLIAASPTVLQQYVSKKYEYRVVVVGNECFVCEIDSQKGEKSKKDWRAYEFEKVSFKTGSLPVNLQKKLVAFAKLRGFKLCTFDLIMDVKGDFYFLEMNRPGSWLFVEAFTGLPISAAIIKLIRK